MIELTKQISELETTSETNIAENHETLELEIKELQGVPKKAIARLAKEKAVKGKAGFV